jgi:hypothetical protein
VLTCRWERFSDIAHEIIPLLKRHEAETNSGHGAYLPDWERYYAFDRAGSCAVWTARTLGGALVGHVIWLTTRGLHNVEMTFADAEVYLAPEWREGMRGYRFIKLAIGAMRENKPDVIRFNVNELYRGGEVGLLLKRLGLRRVGSIWQWEAQT